MKTQAIFSLVSGSLLVAAQALFETVAFGINPSGAIVGQYWFVSGGPQHGFVALPPGRN